MLGTAAVPARLLSPLPRGAPISPAPRAEAGTSAAVAVARTPAGGPHRPRGGRRVVRVLNANALGGIKDPGAKF